MCGAATWTTAPPPPDVAAFQASWNGVDTDSGQVMWVDDATTSGQSTLDDIATASIEGDELARYFGLTGASGYLGFQVRSAADGTDDLFAVEHQGGSSNEGALWLLGGGLMSGTNDVDDVTLLAWEGRSADAGPGREVAIGDLDGDGLADAVVGSPYSDSFQGRVYLLLSSDG